MRGVEGWVEIDEVNGVILDITLQGIEVVAVVERAHGSGLWGIWTAAASEARRRFLRVVTMLAALIRLMMDELMVSRFGWTIGRRRRPG